MENSAKPENTASPSSLEDENETDYKGSSPQYINDIEDKLSGLNLTCLQKEYYECHVFPLLNTLYMLSTASYNLASSVNQLYSSSVKHADKSDLKHTDNLVYKINHSCSQVYDELQREICIMLKIE